MPAAAERLAELDLTERDAVARLVRTEIVDESRASRRIDRWVNAGFFAAGVLADGNDIVVTKNQQTRTHAIRNHRLTKRAALSYRSVPM